MKLKSFQIRNFKCFEDTGEVGLSEGMNIVAGPNNAGKTALLQALELRFPQVPHRGPRSVPRKGVSPQVNSEVAFTISVTSDQFIEAARRLNLSFPMPDFGRAPESLRAVVNLQQSHSTLNGEAVWKWLQDQPELSFKLVRSGGKHFSAPVQPSHGLFDDFGGRNHSGAVPHFTVSTVGGGAQYHTQHLLPPQDLGVQIAQKLVNLGYRFNAERFVRGTSDFGTGTVLDQNATNLAEVLHVLQSSNPDSYGDFISLVRDDLTPRIRPFRNTIWTKERGRTDEPQQAYGGADHRCAEAG